MLQNHLEEIPFEDWPKLRDLYKSRKCESNSYDLIQNRIELRQKGHLVAEKFYSFNGDWNDGTFLLQNPDLCVMFNTCEYSQARLLMALNCLSKNTSHHLTCFPDRLRNTVESFQLILENDSIEFKTGIWLHILLEKALQFDPQPPKDITLSRLHEEDIAYIDEEWPNRYPGSKSFIAQCVASKENIGAYDENGNLVSWCLILATRSLGHLYVNENHRRKGLGSLMIQVLSKQLAERGIEATATVYRKNIASRSTFKKLGFQEIDNVHWLKIPARE